MADFDNPLDQEFLDEIYKDKRETWGDDLTRPRQFIIGRLNTDGTTSTVVTSGELGRVWVREPGDDTGDAVQAINTILQPHEIAPKRPVMVKQQRGEFIIIGKALESANYDAQLPVAPQRPTNREQFNAALITPSKPDSSFYAYYRGGMVNYGGVEYLSTDIPSSDFSGTVPGSNALSIKVEFNPTAGTWHETTGSAFTFSTMRAAFKNGDLDTATTGGRIIWGWIRLYNGQTAIELDDIFIAGNMFNTVDPSKFVWITPDSDARNVIRPSGDFVPLTIRGFASPHNADLFRLQEGASGDNVFVVEDDGKSYFQNKSDGTTAFRIRKAAGAAVLQVNTTNGWVSIGVGSPSQMLTVGAGGSIFNEFDANNGNMTINNAVVSAHYDLLLGGDGVLAQQETTTPTADADYGKTYPKDDNLYYFQDGAGTEHIMGGQGLNKAWNGTFKQNFDLFVTEAGGVITGSLDATNGGDLKVFFSGGETTLDTDPTPLTVTLTAGTATAPLINHVYILQSTGVLTAKTSTYLEDWPTAEHAPVAIVILRTAAITQTDGAFGNQNINNRPENDNADNQGWIQIVGNHLRSDGSKWLTGVTPTITIVTNGGAPDDVYLANTSGLIRQFNPQTFPALDMQTGDDIHIANRNGAAYTTVSNLNGELSDSTAASMSGKYFWLTFWGIINKSGEVSHLLCNLPTDSYNTQANALADVDATKVRDIPTDWDNTGFLIAETLFRHQSAGSGTWTEVVTNTLLALTGGTGGGAIVDPITSFSDAIFNWFNSADPTKLVDVDLSALSAATTRTLAIQDVDGTIALVNAGAVDPRYGAPNNIGQVLAWIGT